jgi:hypothetical protein
LAFVLSLLILFAISLAISTGVLIVSMLVTSWWFEGVDFGPVNQVLVKSAALLVTVTAISLIPYGSLVNIVVWFAGLIFLFRIGFLEALVLTAVNGFLNLWLQSLLSAALRKVDPACLLQLSWA